jgi:hypothetical protein
MSDSTRRPTQKLTRTRRDPRIDSVPPPREERLTTSSPVPKGAVRTTLQGRGTMPPSRSLTPKAPSVRARAETVEEQLARERAERAADADHMGQLIARAIKAETRAKQLEDMVARLNDERAKLEAEFQSAKRAFAEQLAEQRERFAAEPKTGRNKALAKAESSSSLSNVRTVATELVRLLDRLGDTPPPSKAPLARRDTPMSGTIPPGRTNATARTNPPGRTNPPKSTRGE